MPSVGFQTEGPLAESPGTIFDYEGSLGESMSAAFGRAIDTNPATQGILLGRYAWESKYGQQVGAEDARREARNLGLNLDIPDTGISRYELDAMMYLKQREIQQNAALARRSGPITSLATFGAGLAGSITDPVNIGASLIPLVPEARYSTWLAQAESAGQRAAIRFGVGAAQGAVGTAAVEPLVYAGAQENQLDYGLGDAFLNVVFGGLIGGGLHSIGGAVHDAFAPSRLRDLAAASPDDVKLRAMHAAVDDLEHGRAVDAESVFRGYAGDHFGTTDAEFLGRSLDLSDAELRLAREAVVLARGGEDALDPENLLSAVRAMGGIKIRDANGELTREGSEVRAVLQDYRPPGIINNKTGKTPDYVREALTEDGWFGSRDTGSTDLQHLYDALERTARGETVVREGQSRGAKLRDAAQKELQAAGVTNADTVTRAASRLAEYRALQQREHMLSPDFEPSEIVWREPGDESIGPLSFEDQARYEPLDPIAEQASVEAQTRAKAPADDLETVAADTAAIDAQINGLKSRDMWTAADDKAIEEADTKSAQLETAAKLYRAAGICMSE